jgi:hypothetical protein
MPLPFQVFAPLPLATEKLLLVHSDALALAFPVTQVQEVKLKAPVIKQDKNSVTPYGQGYIPVVKGQKVCSELAEATLVLLKTPSIKGGLLAIACNDIPVLAAITAQDWKKTEIFFNLWQTDGRAYTVNSITYIFVAGIVKK